MSGTGGIAGNLPASLLSHLEDRGANQAKDELGKLSRILGKIPLLRGTFHTITLTPSGSTTIEHKLGRTPQGWIVCGVTGAPASIYETSSDASYLRLTNTTASTLTVRIWVF